MSGSNMLVNEEIFMEVKVGFKEGSNQRRSKMIVYPDGECYIRNYNGYSRIDQILNPKYFISNTTQTLSHEFTHLLLGKEVSEEACHLLNSVDGFSGYLVDREKRCFVCKKKILSPPYTIHMLTYWHKQCLEEYRPTKDYDNFIKLVKWLMKIFVYDEGKSLNKGIGYK